MSTKIIQAWLDAAEDDDDDYDDEDAEFLWWGTDDLDLDENFCYEIDFDVEMDVEVLTEEVSGQSAYEMDLMPVLVDEDVDMVDDSFTSSTGSDYSSDAETDFTEPDLDDDEYPSHAALDMQMDVDEEIYTDRLCDDFSETPKLLQCQGRQSILDGSSSPWWKNKKRAREEDEEDFETTNVQIKRRKQCVW